MMTQCSTKWCGCSCCGIGWVSNYVVLKLPQRRTGHKNQSLHNSGILDFLKQNQIHWVEMLRWCYSALLFHHSAYILICAKPNFSHLVYHLSKLWFDKMWYEVVEWQCDMMNYVDKGCWPPYCVALWASETGFVGWVGLMPVKVPIIHKDFPDISHTAILSS